MNWERFIKNLDTKGFRRPRRQDGSFGVGSLGQRPGIDVHRLAAQEADRLLAEKTPMRAKATMSAADGSGIAPVVMGVFGSDS